MAYWLLKTEPDSYSWDDLARDRKTVWDGITNPTALKNIRSMTKGDLALFYHTGDERTVVGVAEIASAPQPINSTRERNRRSCPASPICGNRLWRW